MTSNRRTDEGVRQEIVGRGDAESLDAIFSALLLTSFGAWVFGNLLLLKPAVAVSTFLMWLPFLGLLLIFYAISRWSGMPVVGLVATSVLVYLLVSCGPSVAQIGFWIVSLVAVLYTAMRMRPRGISWYLLLLMAAVGVATSFSVLLAYNCFDNLNALRAGVVHKDPLFHASLSAMIKNYGVVSTGLHGLVETPYYVMSHYFAALASAACGKGVFEVYGVFTIVFLIPVLVASVTFCATTLRQVPTLAISAAWGFVCLSLVLPQMFLWKWGVNPQTMISESSLLGMAFFALGLPYVFVASLQQKDIIIVAVLAAVMAYTKLPTAMIFAGLLVAKWVFVGRVFNKNDFFAAALVSIVTILFFALMPVGATEGSRWGVLHYVRTFAWRGEDISQLLLEIMSGESVSVRSVLLGGRIVVYFWLFHFLFSWTALAVIVVQRGVISLWSNSLAVALWASVLGGSFFLMFFVDAHAAAYYFSHPAFFVAVPVLAAAFASSKLLAHGRWALAAFLVASLTLICHYSKASFLKNSMRSVVHRQTHESTLIDALLDIRRNAPLNVAIQAPPNVWEYEPIKFPGEIWETPRLGGPPWHSASPFVYPAMSERPWVGVIPPASMKDPESMRFSADRRSSHGNAFYKINPETGEIIGNPVLSRNMQVMNWTLPEKHHPAN